VSEFLNIRATVSERNPTCQDRDAWLQKSPLAGSPLFFQVQAARMWNGYRFAGNARIGLLFAAPSFSCRSFSFTVTLM
jgi:hypothetical protein